MSMSSRCAQENQLTVWKSDLYRYRLHVVVLQGLDGSNMPVPNPKQAEPGREHHSDDAYLC